MRRGGFVAIYATSAAVFVIALLAKREILNDARWLAFAIGIFLFAVLADKTTLPECQPRWSGWLLIAQGVVALALIPLGGYQLLTPMLTFITVSESQVILPRRWANVFDAALVAAVALVFGTYDVALGLEVGAGYAAGYVFIVAFTRIARSEEQARRELERAHRQLADYANQVERLATMRERNRLAREVHDSLGHYLTALNVQLEIATKLMETNPARAREATAQAKQLASEGLAEVRRSVAALRPSPLDDAPLPQAIRNLVDETRCTDLAVSFEQTGSARPLSPEIETVLYRAAQEALTNVRKHARASAVEVRLIFEADIARLGVRDNGIGRQEARDGVGLSGLRERVTAIGGQMWAENYPDGGFVVEVTVPCGGRV
jgi:signal transduction histidine kinase